MKFWIVGVFAFFASVGTVQAQTDAERVSLAREVSSINLVDLLVLAEIRGQTVLNTDQEETRVEVQDPASGLKYSINGQSCSDDRCMGIMFMAIFDPDERFTLDLANRLNLQYGVGKFLISQERMVLSRYVILDGGMRMGNLSMESETF